jgi:hypothetical protein
MKHILFTLLLFSSFTSFSQFVKGDKYLGGTIYLNAQNAPDSPDDGRVNKSTSVGLYPSVGFLLNENFAIGGQLGYSSSYSKSTYNGSYTYEYESTGFSGGIFARKYFMLSDKFFFSLIGLMNYQKGSDIVTYTDPASNESNEEKSKGYILSASIRPNFIFFPTPKWAFEASIGNLSYHYNKNVTDDKSRNNFNMDYGTISFGLSYYFRRSE